MENYTYKAYEITETANGSFERNITTKNTSELPQNGTLIKVAYSSLNYKDALSATGNKGVTRKYPFTPGVDAAGVVVATDSPILKPGDNVLVTGFDLGMNTCGGFGEYINVPCEWVIPLPYNLSLMESMALGTAGFTAGLSMLQLLRFGQTKEQGPLLVTGATGGVGSVAVAIAAKLGFVVGASTSKMDKADYLKTLGASEIIARGALEVENNKGLLRPQWGGAIDTVGGNTLSNVLKSTFPQGNVTTCGNVSSTQLNTTIFPFILNGVNLLGINSASTPMRNRTEVWKHLSTDWKPDFEKLELKVVPLHEIGEYIDKILKGKISGRVVIKHEDN